MNISGVKKKIPFFIIIFIFTFFASKSYADRVGGAQIFRQPFVGADLKNTVVNVLRLKDPLVSQSEGSFKFEKTGSIVVAERTVLIKGSETNTAPAPAENYNLRRDYSITPGIISFGEKNISEGQFTAIKSAFGDKYRLTQDNFFAINTPSGTHYYIKVTNPSAKGGYDKLLIGSAVKGDILIIPEKGVKELPVSQGGDITDTDMSYETGFHNYLSKITGGAPGSITAEIRSNDNSTIQRENIRQEKETVSKELNSVEKELNSLREKEAAGTLSSEERQRILDLESKKSDLLNREENLRRIELQQTANSKSDTISFAECKLFSPQACVVPILATIANVGLKLVAWALGLVGVMFDYSIELAVNSAEFIERLGVVTPVWTLLRDLLNMTFIFILVWIAIQIIIDRKKYTVKKDVVRVVVVAILINFSLFATKVFIDGSNLATLQLYQATKSDGDIQKKQDDHNISTRIMTTLGLATVYDIGDIFKGGITRTINGCGGAQGTIISVAVFGSIFMIILGLAFLTVGLLFFTRMANIIYLLVTSPLWVWGHILDSEPFVKIRTDWWKRMMRVVKFPVVFMLYMFVAVFAFTKMFALSYGGMSFLTLFCVSDDTSIIGQLPLILNFCLVIWVILAAVKYGMENSEGGFEKAISGKLGGWAQSASTGLAKKIGDRAQKIASAAPKATLYGAGQVGKGTFQMLGGFKGLNKVGARIAASGKAPAFVRNMGANLADKTKDPKFFGKTKKERTESWKKYWSGSGEEDAKRTAEVAESADKAPKYREEGHDAETDVQFKNRVKAFAKAKAGIYLDRKVLDYEDPINNKSHEENIVENALAGVEEIKDSAGNTTGYKFSEEKMRKHINNVFDAHTEKGRLKDGLTHSGARTLAGLGLRNNPKFEARQKAFKAATEARFKDAQSLEKLRADLKKSEDDFKNHPETVADLDTMIQNNDPKLKGVISLASVRGMERDIANLKQQISLKEAQIQQYGGSISAQTLDSWKASLDKDTENLEKKEKKFEGTKKGVIQNREKVQKKIEELKEKIKEQEKKK